MDAETFQYRLLRVSLLAGSMVFTLHASPSGAETLQAPWECSNYTGDAQTRCVNAFMEAQQKKIAELEGKLQAQEGTVSQLKSQLDRQTTATADLQRQFTERSGSGMIPVPYPYSYGYPLGLGLGLHFGSAGIHTSPFYSPFWGHRHYGYWGYGW